MSEDAPKKGRRKVAAAVEPPAKLEDAIARLEEIAAKLESGEADLEESVALYAEGRKLGAHCLDRLQGLERQVLQVMEGADGSLRTEPLPEAEEDGP